MIITGSAIFVEPGTDDAVVERLKEFPGVTFHVKSDTGTELVVNLEAEGGDALELLCRDLKNRIPEIVDITHIYVNFEEEIEKMQSGRENETKTAEPLRGSEIR
jgi:hypothetical protein